MAFLGCHEPLLTDTDWSPCFRRNFLNTLLPLVALGFSLILCIAQVISRSARARRSALRVARLDPAASNFHINDNDDAQSEARPGFLARFLVKLLPWTAPKLIPSLSSEARYQRLPASAAEAGGNGAHKDAAPLSSAALSVYHTENAVILNEVHDTLSLDSAQPREGLWRLEVVKRAWEAVGCVLLAGLHATGTTLTRRSQWEWAWVALWAYLGLLSAFALSNRHSFFMHKLYLMSLAAVVAVSNFRSALIATTPHQPAVITLSTAQLILTLIVVVPTFFFPMATKTPRRLRAVMQTMKARKVYGEARTVIPSPRRPASPLGEEDLDEAETAAANADEESRVRHRGSEPIASISTIKGGIQGPSGLAESAAPMRPANDNRPEPDEKGLQMLIPAPEARASIFSRAFFSFVTPFLVKHSKVQFTLPAVPDLPGPDRAACVVADFRASSSARRQARSSTAAHAAADEEAAAGGVNEEGLMPSDRSLVLRLIKYFAPLLVLQCIFAFGEAVLTLTPAIGLRWVLTYIAERDAAKLSTGRDDAQPATPFHMAVLFAVFMALGQLLASMSAGQALIIGRRICIRLRAILVFEIINKALRRKDTGSAAAAKKAADTLPDPVASGAKVNGAAAEPAKKDDEGKAAKEEHGRASDGEVTNLVSVDVFKVSEIGAYLHYAFPSAPVQIAVCVFLLVRMLGSAAVAGFGVLFLSFPLQMLTARLFIKIQKLSLEATDQRLNLTTEVLNCIKTVKFFAWEKSFEQRLDETRQKELRILRYRFLAWLLNAVTYFGVPMIVTLVTFAFHTKVLHRPLRAETAFTALALLNALRRPLDMLPDMIVNILSSLVSIRRIDAYLREEETAKYEQLLSGEERVEGDPVVGFQDATFTYTEDAEDDTGLAQTFCLRDLNLTFPTGELSVIAGPVGSGKTTLLMSLLGETRQIGGRTFMPCAVARALLETDPVTGLSESVAYCSQSPWLLGATVKENVLFGMPYEERRYKAVIKACALEPDLKILEYGDETEVGEKGTSLSGGQKARLALARALYSPAKYLLVDDALSAVDAHTAKHLYRQYFKGPLMQGRTCILVTHAVSLCLPGAAYVVALNEGNVVAAGSPDTVKATGIFDEDLASSSAPSKANSVKDGGDDDGEAAEITIEEVLDENARAVEQAEIKKKQDKKAAHSNEETYSAGGISMKAYALYLRSFATTQLGLLAFYLLCIIVFIGSRLMDVSTAAWLRRWVGLYAIGGDDEDAPARQAVAVAAAMGPAVAGAHASNFVRSSVPTAVLATFNAFTVPIQRLLASPVAEGVQSRGSLVFADSPSDIASALLVKEPTSDQTAFYLSVYALLVVVYLIFCVLRDGVTLWGSLVASRVLYRKLMKSIIMATPQWFDRTPVGRIMNRLSKDIETVDQDLAPQLLFFFDVSIQSFVIVVISCYAMPAFFPASLLVIAAYWSIGALYIVSSRDLKRIESVTRSPIFTLVGEVLSGSVLIRAYGDASRFTRHCLRLIDRTNRPFFFLWYENRWLSIRVETVAVAVTLSMALFLVSRNTVDAALAGFTLSFTTQLVDSVLWVLRCYTMVEINGNSVERIAEYLEIPSERIEGQEPPAAWPSAKGSIEVQDLAVRYTPEFPRVLDGISFKVAPGEKVGIVGRTGSGKSTLALSFFRFLEAEQGKIVIDGIDISTVPLATLRDRLTVIPQDAQLFSGTIRSNLDPFGRCEDDELWAALKRCQLAASRSGATPSASRGPSAAPTPRGSDDEAEDDADGEAAQPTAVVTSLDMVVEQNGRNFSAGQKQLLALARGLLKLRSSSILILDESTANLDTASDNHMQRTIRTQMANATILTIAHRLRTIGDYDKVLTLGNGKVLEYDSPANLLRKEGSVYRELAERSGEWDALVKLAETAERKGKGKAAQASPGGKERDGAA